MRTPQRGLRRGCKTPVKRLTSQKTFCWGQGDVERQCWQVGGGGHAVSRGGAHVCACVCVCVCPWVCSCVHVCLSVCPCTHMYVCVLMYVCTCVPRVCTRIHERVCSSVCTCMLVFAPVCQHEEVEKQQERRVERPWADGEGGGGARESRGAELRGESQSRWDWPCGPQLGLPVLRAGKAAWSVSPRQRGHPGGGVTEARTARGHQSSCWPCVHVCCFGPQARAGFQPPLVPSAEGLCAVHNIPNCTRVVESQDSWPAAHEAEQQVDGRRKVATSWRRQVPPAAQAQNTGSHLAVGAVGKPRAESRAQLTERSWASGFVTSVAGASASTSRETPNLRFGRNTGQTARETGHTPGLHSAPRHLLHLFIFANHCRFYCGTRQKTEMTLSGNPRHLESFCPEATWSARPTPSPPIVLQWLLCPESTLHPSPVPKPGPRSGG